MGHERLAHWWSPDEALLGQAFLTFKEMVHAREPATAVRVFHPDDLLVLLRSLNGRIGGNGGQKDIAHAEQLWILARADRMASDQMDILRRIALHYPELRLRLVFFSLRSDAPALAEGVYQIQVPGHANELAMRDVARHAVKRSRWWPWVWLAGLLLMLVGGWWMARWAAPADVPIAPDIAPASGREPSASAPLVLDPELPASAPLLAPGHAATPASEMHGSATDPASVSATRRWLTGLPENSLVVVHAEAASWAEAQAFQLAGQALLTHARTVVITGQSGRPESFLVVTAPFRSLDRVQGYMQRLPWKAQARSMSREELLTLMPN